MNKEALRKLADFLHKLPAERFTMARFRTLQDDADEPSQTGAVDLNTRREYRTVRCYTSGCVLGHLPEALNLSPSELPRVENGRAIDFTAVSSKFLEVPFPSPVGQWLFDAMWCRTDNTPQGAARRIEYVLEHGSQPRDYLVQIYGYTPGEF